MNTGMNSGYADPNAQEPTTPFSDSNTSEAATSGLDPDTFDGDGTSSFKLKD